MDDDLPEIKVSLIEQGVGINHDRDKSSDVSCICQQCDDSADTVPSALPQVAAVAHDTAMSMGMEEALALKVSLPAQARDR